MGAGCGKAILTLTALYAIRILNFLEGILAFSAVAMFNVLVSS